MRKFPFLSTSLILALILGTGVGLAKLTHKIKNLSASYDPSKPLKGETAGLDLSFLLKSSTGIERNRIKVNFNGASKDLSTISDENFTITDNGDGTVNGVEFADVLIKIPQLVFSNIDNNLEVLYVLSDASTDPPLARAEINKKASFNKNDNDNADDNGDTSTSTPELFRMIVEEVNGTGMVSTTAKQFRINLYHDERVLGKVTDNGFNMDSSPIFKNLKIISQNPNNKDDKTEIQDDFIFDIEGNGSVSSTLFDSTISNELYTSYISQGNTFTERQNLIFKLNLKSFAKSTGVVLEDNVIYKDQDKIEITAQELDFNSLTIDESEINFGITSSKKKKYFFDSDEFTIVGVFNGDETIDSIDDVEYFTQVTNKQTDKPKIKGSSSGTTLKATGNNGSLSISGSPDSYTVNLGTVLSLKSTLKNLEKKGFYDSSTSKTLNIPVNVIAKTSNGLDLIINGDLSASKTLIFESVESNGASL